MSTCCRKDFSCSEYIDFPNQICFFGNCGLLDLGYLADGGGADGFEEIRASHTGANMAGIINNVLARYGIQDRILSFTSDSASNNRTLTEVLNNTGSLLSIEWCQLENDIPCRANVVQLILGAFMSWIKVQSRDGHKPSGFKAGYIDKVIRLNNGFHKTVEKVMCLRSHTLEPILQMH